MSYKNKKSLDFEINLLPFISVLAVCISFLLLSAVWVQVGTFSLSQALGTEAADSKNDNNQKMSLWVQFENDGSVRVSVKEGERLKTSLRYADFASMKSKRSAENFEKFVGRIKQAAPNLRTALILPAANSSYEDMISVMDTLKHKEIIDIGVAPL